MTFEQLYSGSKANLYVVTADSGKRLLIECGVTWKNLQKALNYDLSNIDGCLLSHEHQDHSRVVKDVMAAGIDVFASAGTFEVFGIKNERKANIIKDKTIIQFNGDFKARAFSINHDAAEPLGFVVKSDDEYLLFATDTSHLRQRFTIPFDIIAIECSYDKEVLARKVQAGEVNEEGAKRLLTSHMERRETVKYLQEFCDLSKCREIHLLHMSGNHMDKLKTKTEFEKRLFIETKVKNENSKSNNLLARRQA